MSRFGMSRLSLIPHDVKDFLEGYPDNDDSGGIITGSRHQQQQNLEFYSNKLKCRPDGLLIDELLERRHGKYNELEKRHGFIQWLFPIPEQGVNMLAHPLRDSEIAEMNASPEILDRVRKAYELMLDFYGMRLLNTESGLIGRKEHDWRSRYENLSYSSHNNLRITRILKCLSILSHPHYAAPFVLHVLNEQSEHNLLNSVTLQSSLDRWWANCNRDEKERETVQDIVKRVRASARTRTQEDGWTFTREMYEHMINSRERGDGLVLPDSV